jgi:hypothetical protein
MKKLLFLAITFPTATAWGQTINYTPVGYALATSSNGLAPYTPLSYASGLGPVNFTPQFFVPMCSATGAPPFSQCTFGSGTVTGTGTINSLSEFTAGSAIGNSLFTDSGTAAAYTGTGGFAVNVTSGSANIYVNDVSSAGQAALNFQAGGTSEYTLALSSGSGSLSIYDTTTLYNALSILSGNTTLGETGKTVTLNGIPILPATYTTGSNTITQPATAGTLQIASQGTITSGVGLFGVSVINTVIAGTKAAQAGHFTNLNIITTLGGTCSTLPQFNVFDGTTNVGTALAATATTQTKGQATTQAQSLTFAAGDQIGIYISTAGGTCTTDQFTVTAQYSTP